MLRSIFSLLASVAILGASAVNAESYCFAYTFTGSNAGAGTGYSVEARGIITTNTSLSTTSRTAALITGVSGTRVFTNATSSQTLSFTGLASTPAASQIVFSNWPYTDTVGWAFQLSGVAATEYGVGSTSVGIASSYDPLIETTGSQTTSVGDLIVKIGQQASTVDSCTFYEAVPTPTKYSFCYTISSDGTDSYSLAGIPWTTYGFGTFTATTPVQQEGRAAIVISTMTGYRILKVNGTTYTQRIIAAKPPMSDLYSGGVKTDNYLYLNSPYLDQYGLLFTLDSGVWYPDGQLATPDINFEYDQFGLLQYIDLSSDGSKYLMSSRQWFDYQVYTDGAAAYTCPGAPSSWVPGSDLPAGTTTSSSSSGLSSGAIAGITIGVVVGALLLVAVFIYLYLLARAPKYSNQKDSSIERTSAQVEESAIEIH